VTRRATVALLVAVAGIATVPGSDGAGESAILGEVRRLSGQVARLIGETFDRPPVAVRVTDPMREVAATIRVQRVVSSDRLAARGRAWADLGLGIDSTPQELWNLLAADLEDVGFDPEGNRLLVSPDRLTAQDFDPETGAEGASTVLMMTGVRPDEPLLVHLLLHVRQRERLGRDFLDTQTDRMLAAAAWAEGEANLTAVLFLFEGLGIQEDIVRMRVDPAALLDGSLVPAAVRGGQSVAAKMAQLVYAEGYDAAAAAYRDGAWDALRIQSVTRRTMRDLVHGTAAPETKYAPFAPLELGASWRELDTDTLGESAIAVLIAEQTGKDNLALLAAEGWLADQVVRWETDAAGPTWGITQWNTRWVGEEDAAEFLEAFVRGLRRRFPDAEWTESEAGGGSLVGGGRKYTLGWAGSAVSVLVAPPGWAPAAPMD